MGAEAEGSKSNTEEEETSRVHIPDFLTELLGNFASTGEEALGQLSDRILPGDVVAPVDPTTTAAQDLAIDRATNGPFISTAQDQTLATSQGVDLSQFLDPTALAALTTAAGGQDLTDFLPPETLQALGLATGAVGQNIDNLNTGATSSAIPGISTDQLSKVAGGDFLFGGEGFDAAVQAAVNAARPQIQSIFGRSGAGGATGGLAEAAVGQSAVDAFARQFGAERGRQDSAAGLLAQLGLADKGQQTDISQFLSSLGIGAGSELGRFAEGGENRELAASGILGDLGSLERDRSVAATGDLPGIGAADINLLDAVGGARQGQAQRELSGPIQALLALLSGSAGNLPLDALLAGRDREGSSTTTGFSGGFSSDVF